MTTTRSSYGSRLVYADAMRNKIRGVNAFLGTGACRVLPGLPQGSRGSTVKVPIDIAMAEFRARTEGSTISASDLGDAFQDGTVEQASIGFKITGGALRSGGEPMVQMDNNVRQALPAYIEDSAAAAAAASTYSLALTATPTATITESQLDDLVWSFGDEADSGVVILGHSGVVKNIAALKDLNGARVFRRGAMENSPLMVHGKPVAQSDAVPQYYEASNYVGTLGGTTVVGDLSVGGSLKRSLKKILYVKIAAGGLGAAATFSWALARPGETPTYSTAVNLAATIALSGTNLVLTWNLARTYTANDLWTCSPSADTFFLRPDAVLFMFNDGISYQEQVVAAEDATEYWTHVYHATVALQRMDGSDSSGIAKLRTKL